jgi:hypothetical protein
LPNDILDRRKKGFGIPRYYLKDIGDGRMLQEHILRSMFLDSSASAGKQAVPQTLG